MAEIKTRQTKNGEYRYSTSVRIKGTPSQNKTFKRKTDAKEWASKTETQIRESMDFPNRVLRKITVNNLIDRFIENELPKRSERRQKEFMHALAWFQKEIGDYYLSNVTTAMLINCREKLIKQHVEIPIKNGKKRISDKLLAPATVNHYMMYMRIVFSYCVNDLDIMDINPMSKVKKLPENNQRTRYLEIDEINKLLKTLQNNYPMTYLVVLIALLTDSRKSEILNLTWKDVDFEHHMIYFMKTKNDEPKGIPMHDFLYDELSKYKQSRKFHQIQNDYLFPDKFGNPKKILVEKYFVRAVKQCGIKDFRFHDLRHTSASWQAMEGISQPITQKILGHKTPAMTSRYSHLRNEYLRPAINHVGDTMLKEFLENSQ